MTSQRQHESSPFFDASLKSAVVQAWGSENAPHGLRDHVRDLIGSTQSSNRKHISGSTIRNRLMWSLAAGIAIVLLVQIKSLLPTSPRAAVKLSALPTNFYDNLVRTHDRCNLQPQNHHRLLVAQNDDAAIVKTMQTQLSQAVLVARPAGWTFRGAAICAVGDVPSGHLLFARGSDVLSIFSLPEWAVDGLTDGLRFQSTDQGHPIVAFSRNGGLFCLVASGASGDMTVNQLLDLRSIMEAGVSARPGCACGPPSQPPAELLVTSTRR